MTSTTRPTVGSAPVLLVEKTGPIYRLTLNRPESLNALNRELGDALIAALDEAGHDDDVRVVVLAGAGRAFCAGDDIRASASAAAAGQPPPRRDLLTSIEGNYFNFARAFRSVPKPILTRVHGFAYGAGMDLVLASDISIAASDATIAAIFVRRAIIGGTAQLPRYIGLKKAMEMMLTGEPVDAAEAERLGLINYAVPPDELDATIEQWAERLAAGPTRVMGNIKHATYRGLDMHFQDAVMLAAMAQGESSRTDDGREGRASFVEKRQPNFTGR